MPENICTFEHCENLELLLTAVSSHVPFIPNDCAHLKKAVMCEPVPVECIDFLCKICCEENTLTQELLSDSSDRSGRSLVIMDNRGNIS